MPKIAFMFPGVGSEYAGMGKSFYENFKIVRNTFEEASDILNLDLDNICFEPSREKELKELGNAQVSLLTLSIAVYRAYMKEIGLQPHFCAGYSLGEYSALCSAGVIEFPDALKLVRERGRIIDKVASAIDGTMAWVINLDSKLVETVCEAFSEGDNQVFVSAYDTPTQVSISGHTAPLMKAARELEKKGIVYPLRLSGPFHCPLMKKAAEQMKSILKKFTYQPPTCSVIANQNVQPYKDSESVLINLSLQLTRPIHWRTTVEYFMEHEVDIAIEMGPKNVLKFILEKNTHEIKTYTMDNDKDLDILKKSLLSP